MRVIFRSRDSRLPLFLELGFDVLELALFLPGRGQEGVLAPEGLLLEEVEGAEADDEDEEDKVPDVRALPRRLLGYPGGRDLLADVLGFRLQEVDADHGYFSTLRVAKPTATPKIGAMSLK
jgi:hypothetical protein